jgi:hypothetical protein
VAKNQLCLLRRLPCSISVLKHDEDEGEVCGASRQSSQRTDIKGNARIDIMVVLICIDRDDSSRSPLPDIKTKPLFSSVSILPQLLSGCIHLRTSLLTT